MENQAVIVNEPAKDEAIRKLLTALECLTNSPGGNCPPGYSSIQAGADMIHSLSIFQEMFPEFSIKFVPKDFSKTKSIISQTKAVAQLLGFLKKF